MKWQRFMAVLAGAALGFAAVGAAAFAVPWPHAKTHRAAKCLPYFLLPKNELICGAVTVYINPDGSRVLMKTADLKPMPRPQTKGNRLER